jgi:hypothetical protein
MAADHGSFEKKQTPSALFVTAFETITFFLSLEAGIWMQFKTKALWES